MLPISLRLALLSLVISYPVLSAQNKSDESLLRQARSLYYTPNSRPAYIACDSTLDWDHVATETRMPQTADYRHGLELAKAMTISFVTRGPHNTEVTVVGDERIERQKQEMREQIAGFFREYWELADGRVFPNIKRVQKVDATPDGYIVTIPLENDSTGTLLMDKSFLVTKITAERAPFKLQLTPKFMRAGDGLLHLRSMLVERTLGQSREVWEYSFDYQQVGGFYIPQHLTTSIPGAFSSTHTFSNCNAFDKQNAPPEVRNPAKP